MNIFMKRGVSFQIPGKPGTYLFEVLKGIDIEKYCWFVEDQSEIWDASYKQSFFEKGRYDGRNFIEKIKENYYILFLKLQATYKDYYKTRRRQKYLIEQAIKNGDISYDMLTTDETSGENILNSGIQDISETVIHKVMLDRLRGCLSFFSETDRQLLESIYFKEMSEREFSKISGIPQRTVNDRKRRILAKLKKYLEN